MCPAKEKEICTILKVRKRNRSISGCVYINHVLHFYRTSRHQTIEVILGCRDALQNSNIVLNSNVAYMTTTTNPNFMTEENIAYNITARDDDGNIVLKNNISYATVDSSLTEQQ